MTKGVNSKIESTIQILKLQRDIEAAIKNHNLVEIAHGLYHLSIEYKEATNYTYALEILRKSLSIIHKGYKIGIFDFRYWILYKTYILIEIGLNYKNLCNYDRAVEVFHLAIAYIKKYSAMVYDAPASSLYRLYDILGDILEEMEQEEVAKIYQKKAVEECENQIQLLMEKDLDSENKKKLFTRFLYVSNNSEDKEKSYKNLCLAECLIKEWGAPMPFDDEDVINIYWDKALLELFYIHDFDSAQDSTAKLVYFAKRFHEKNNLKESAENLAYGHYLNGEALLGSKRPHEAKVEFEISSQMYQELFKKYDDKENISMFLMNDSKICICQAIIESEDKNE